MTAQANLLRVAALPGCGGGFRSRSMLDPAYSTMQEPLGRAHGIGSTNPLTYAERRAQDVRRRAARSLDVVLTAQAMQASPAPTRP